MPLLSISSSDTYNRLSTNASGIQRHTLDSLANALCTSHHSTQCSYCTKPLADILLICSRCGSANHTHCVRNLPSRPTACPNCHRPCSPIHSPSHHGCRNFYNVLNFFRYPVQSPTLSNKRLRLQSTTTSNSLPLLDRKPPATAHHLHSAVVGTNTQPQETWSGTTDVERSANHTTKMDA